MLLKPKGKLSTAALEEYLRLLEELEEVTRLWNDLHHTTRQLEELSSFKELYDFHRLTKE